MELATLDRAPGGARVEAGNEAAWTERRLESLWDRHGARLYTLALALVGDEKAATRVVTMAMVDLALSSGSESSERSLRALARRVYVRSREVVTEPTGGPQLPARMLWLGRLARLQRASLALCVFGGHTHREAAELLGVPAGTVADLLTAGLRELGHLAADRTASSA